MPSKTLTSFAKRPIDSSIFISIGLILAPGKKEKNNNTRALLIAKRAQSETDMLEFGSFI